MGFLWLLMHRFRVAWLEDEVEIAGLDLAIDERRAEAGSGGSRPESSRWICAAPES